VKRDYDGITVRYSKFLVFQDFIQYLMDFLQHADILHNVTANIRFGVYQNKNEKISDYIVKYICTNDNVPYNNYLPQYFNSYCYYFPTAYYALYGIEEDWSSIFG